MMRFDRFTERAQEAAQRSAEIIQRYGHNQIDTEHILLALIEQPQGVISQILETLKVDAAALTDKAGMTASGPPLPVLLRALRKLADLRAASPRDDIPSRHADIQLLRKSLT